MCLILFPSQCHEVWTSQFPFLHSPKDVIPPSKACLYGHINWSLAQTQQQSSGGLSQSFPSKRGDKARQWTGFHFMVLRRPYQGPCQGLMVHLWLRGLTLRVGMRPIQVAKSLLLKVSPPLLPILRGREAMGDGTPDVSQSSASSSSSSAVFQVGMLFSVCDQWRHITSNRFVLNRVTIFSLGPVLPCSITSGSSMSRKLQLIIPLFRRR